MGDAIATSRENAQKNNNLYGANFFERISGATFLEDASLEKVKSDIANGIDGHFSFEMNGNRSYAHYASLGVNDWYMILIVDHNTVAATAMKIQGDAMRAAVAIVLCFAIIFGYVYFAIQRNAKHLYELAYYDKLTGLPNLDRFKVEISEIMKRHPERQFSCVVYDISNFKFVNDRYSFEVGDKVLKEMARIGKEFIDKEPDGTATISRLHTDTFAIFMLSDLAQNGDPKRSAFIEKLQKEIDFVELYTIDLTLGRYIAQPGDSADKIIEKANMAHANAQGMPPNIFVDYSEEHHDTFVTEVIVRNKVEDAFKNEEFVVFLQPKFSFATDSMCGAEALVRWKQNEGFLPPNSFIPVLERNGMIVQLDLYIFEKCCQLLKQWEIDGQPLIPISINFSRHHLSNNNLADKLRALAEKYHVSPSNLIVEFTETVTIEHQTSIIEVISHLHEHGFLVSMDDFGSGYSSLGFLGEISVDEIKLDRSFVNNIVMNPKASTIVKNVISMAGELGISVVAEGVETIEQRDVLKAMNCTVAQGYYYSPPVPCELVFNSEAFTPPPPETPLLSPFRVDIELILQGCEEEVFGGEN